MPCAVLLGPHQAHAPTGLLRVGHPDLLTRHQPAAGGRLGTTRQGRQVRTRARFTEHLAPQLTLLQRGPNPAFALLVGSVLDDRREHPARRPEIGPRELPAARLRVDASERSALAPTEHFASDPFASAPQLYRI